MIRRVFTLLGALILGSFLFPQTTLAHSGPPFPVIVDQPIPGYSVTLWADPDIGESTFYALLEADGSRSEATVVEINFQFEPESGRSPRTEYKGERGTQRGRIRFISKPILEYGEMWTVDMDILFSDGRHFAFSTEVEATPPGIGPWGLLLFLAPFLAFGGLWVMVFIRRSQLYANRGRNLDRSEERLDTNAQSREANSSQADT